MPRFNMKSILEAVKLAAKEGKFSDKVKTKDIVKSLEATEVSPASALGDVKAAVDKAKWEAEVEKMFPKNRSTSFYEELTPSVEIPREDFKLYSKARDEATARAKQQAGLIELDPESARGASELSRVQVGEKRYKKVRQDDIDLAAIEEMRISEDVEAARKARESIAEQKYAEDKTGDINIAPKEPPAVGPPSAQTQKIEDRRSKESSANREKFEGKRREIDKRYLHPEIMAFVDDMLEKGKANWAREAGIPLTRVDGAIDLEMNAKAAQRVRNDEAARRLSDIDTLVNDARESKKLVPTEE